MIIGIDGNEANVANKVGISEFAYKLIAHFAAMESKHTFIIYLKSTPLPHMPQEKANFLYRVIRPGKLWTQIRLPIDLYLNPKKPDVFFTPSHYAPRFSPIPTVTSVMDLSYIFFPELFIGDDLYQLRNWTEYSVKQAKKVITISKSTKNDIIDEYKVPEEKVSVIYPGIKKMEAISSHVTMQKLQEKYKISKNYILFVGTLQPRKNITRLVEAFSKVLTDRNQKEQLQLVIVGKRGWLYEDILAAPEQYNVTDSVKFLEFVSNDELAVFYKHARCYVLPSLYEGFGLPVLEAMQYDCPVITSNKSSLPEVGGDAVLYVDPENVTDIAEKITLLLTDKKLREELIEKGKKQVKKFSWEKSAKETLSVLEQVGKEKK